MKVSEVQYGKKLNRTHLEKAPASTPRNWESATGLADKEHYEKQMTIARNAILLTCWIVT